MTLDQLTCRVEALESRIAVEDLMQRYAAAADRKYSALRHKLPAASISAAARQQAECFAEDGRWSGGSFGGDLQGRGAIAAFFETSPWLFTAHHYAAGSFVIADGRASVRWRLIEIGIREQDGKVLLLTGAVRQTCRLGDDGWRFSEMAFESLHAIALSSSPEDLLCLIPAGEQFS